MSAPYSSSHRLTLDVHDADGRVVPIGATADPARDGTGSETAGGAGEALKASAPAESGERGDTFGIRRTA